MPIPAGTYPIGGPIVFTGAKPTENNILGPLYDAGARWLGDDGYEVIERSGTEPNYLYRWIPKFDGGLNERQANEVLANIQTQVEDWARVISGPDSKIPNRKITFTNQQLAALLNFNISPNSVPNRATAIARNYNITHNDFTPLGTDVWINVDIAGNDSRRIKLTANPVAVAIDSTAAAGIISNYGAAGFVPVDITLYDAATGGNSLGKIKGGIGLTDVISTTGGLSQSEVDARVEAGVKSGVLDWAETGNTDAIPSEKLVNAPGGIEPVANGELGSRVSVLEHQAADLHIEQHDEWVNETDSTEAGIHVRTAISSSLDIPTISAYDYAARQTITSNGSYNVYLRLPFTATNTKRVLKIRRSSTEETLFEHWIYLGQDATYRYYSWTGGSAGQSGDVYQTQKTDRVETTRYTGDLAGDKIGFALKETNSVDQTDFIISTFDNTSQIQLSRSSQRQVASLTWDVSVSWLAEMSKEEIQQEYVITFHEPFPRIDGLYYQIRLGDEIVVPRKIWREINNIERFTPNEATVDAILAAHNGDDHLELEFDFYNTEDSTQIVGAAFQSIPVLSIVSGTDDFDKRILDDLENKTTDIDVTTSPTLEDAVASEAGIAIFTDTSIIGAGLLNDSRALQESDVASYSFLQSVSLGTTTEAIIVRIEGTLGPLPFALQVGNEVREIHSYHKVLSDSTWDYYYLGSASNERLTIKKHGLAYHTKYHGDLAGQALERINTKQDRLTFDQRVSLADGRIEPRAIEWPESLDGRRTSIGRQWKIFFSFTGFLDRDVWIEGNIEGTPLEFYTGPDGEIGTNPVFERRRVKLVGKLNAPTTLHRIIARLPDGPNQPLLNTQRDGVIEAIGAHATTRSTADPGPSEVQFQVRMWDAAVGGNGLGEYHLTVSLIPNNTPGIQGPSGNQGPPGAFSTSLIGRGNFDATTALQYALDANSTDITIPATGDWAIVNFGSSTSTGNQSGDWHWVDLNALRTAVATYGNNATTTTNKGLLFEDSISSGQDAYLGVTSDGKLLFASSGPVDAISLEIRLVTSTEAAYAGAVASDTIIDEVEETDSDLDGIQPTARALLNDLNHLSVKKVTRLLARVIKKASESVLGLVLLARDEDVGESETDTSRVLTVERGKTLIARAGSFEIAGDSVILVENPDTPITANATNQNKLLLRAGELYRNEPIHYTDPVATYRDFATSDLPTGYTWDRPHQNTPSASSYADNTIVYIASSGHFQRKITGSGRAQWVNYTVPNWRGQVYNEAAGNSKVSAVGDVIYDLTFGKVKVVATITARVPDQWHWEPLLGEVGGGEDNNVRVYANAVVTSSGGVPGQLLQLTSPSGKELTSYLDTVLFANLPEKMTANPKVKVDGLDEKFIYLQDGNTHVTYN